MGARQSSSVKQRLHRDPYQAEIEALAVQIRAMALRHQELGNTWNADSVNRFINELGWLVARDGNYASAISDVPLDL